jgi:hypothetical protein
LNNILSTSEKLKITDFKFIENKEICLYFNNEIFEKNWKIDSLKDFLSFEKK